ncbi:hypothetical protein IAU60_006710 [Kwoniella sp. DSM 27419]
MATVSPLLPLERRLRTIEAQLVGSPSSLIAASDYEKTRREEIRAGRAGPSVTRSLRDAEEALAQLAGESDGLKRLIEGYHQYLPLLYPTGVPPSSTHSQDGGESTEQDPRPVTKADLLPDAAKIAMILEAAADIRGAERDLREIELLKQRGVDGSGQLEDLLPLRGSLIAAVDLQKERSTQIRQARQEVAGLLMRYNDFTSTASDLFIDVHHQLEAVEERVRHLERKKRKDIASRF